MYIYPSSLLYSIYFFVHLSICQFIYLYYLSIITLYKYIYILLVYSTLSTYLFVHLSICLSINLSIYLSIYNNTYIYIYILLVYSTLSIYLSICLSFYLFLFFSWIELFRNLLWNFLKEKINLINSFHFSMELILLQLFIKQI